MLKHIPKSDINFRPFKVYKQFGAVESTGSMYYTGLPNQSILTASFAYNHTGSTNVLTDSQLKENGLYHQLYTMYYRDGYNPFTSYGTIMPKVPKNPQRTLGDGALVLSIPQKMFGEGIKPGSLALYSATNNKWTYDDFYGNLRTNTNNIYLISLDIPNGIITFKDGYDNIGSLAFTFINLNDDGTIQIIGETNIFNNFSAFISNNLIEFDGIIVTAPTILKDIVGNVFYEHGIITITHDVISGSVSGSRKNYFDNYDLQYKSTNTIYENEILLVVGEDEFNISTNSTAYTEINVVSGSISTTYEGNVKYQNSDKYQKQLFADYEYSASIDTTGSFAAPYITTIGLYDENMDMVAVAKLAKPVKSMPDLPVNFLVRFDS
jgi:hypothetical protein